LEDIPYDHPSIEITDALNWPGPAVGLLIVMNPAAPWYLP